MYCNLVYHNFILIYNLVFIKQLSKLQYGLLDAFFLLHTNRMGARCCKHARCSSFYCTKQREVKSWHCVAQTIG